MADAPEALDPISDLNVAISITTSIQTSIQHADTKAAIVLTAHAAATALVADDAGLVAAAIRAGALPAIVVGCLGLALLASLSGALWQAGTCLKPRLTGPAGENRFALPNLAAAGAVPPCASPADQRDEAWALAVALARIAVRKHRAVRGALQWTAATSLVTLGWLALAATDVWQ